MLTRLYDVGVGSVCITGTGFMKWMPTNLDGGSVA
jgi:hypothetical protein